MSVEIKENVTKGNNLKAVCRNCKQETNHSVLADIEKVESNEISGRIVVVSGEKYQIIQCNGCGTLAFREVYIDPDFFDGETGDQARITVYPKYSMETLVEKDIKKLPQNIDRIYKETIGCYNDDRVTLCAGGTRALVEAICFENGIQSKSLDLNEKIKHLAEKGILTEKNASILHNIRLMGNDALHGMEIFSKEELLVAINIIESVLQSMYQMPYDGNKLKLRVGDLSWLKTT